MLPLPPPPPANMGFMMPMFRDWVPKRIQPWIYAVCVLCIQFSGGMYLGCLDDIQGSTNFMIEDVMFLLYANLAGMAIYFPLLFRMKFRFTNQQLLIGAAVTIACCNLITMRCTFLPLLWVVCFISGMAKLQGTFEHISNIQLWITPKRDFSVFFPVLHIFLMTAIEGSGFVAAWFAYHYNWQMMHIFTVGTMCFVVLIQLVLCRPFCPMPQRLSLKGIDFLSAFMISLLMLMLSYIMVYGDYKMWMDSRALKYVVGASLILAAAILYRLMHVRNPFIDLHIFKERNVVPIMIVIIIGEFLLGSEHTMEEILFEEVYDLEELTKESLMIWSLLGVYIGVGICLLWLKVMKWKVWKLIAIAFAMIFVYAIVMYSHIDVTVNIEQYRLGIICRGCATCILAATLMWALDESLHSLESFFMGLCCFNILHMYLAGAAGYGIYTTLFSHFLNDDMSRYGSALTLTTLDMHNFNFGTFMENRYLHEMMTVAIKQIYGIVLWVSGGMALIFALLDIPAVRTNIRKVPRWPVFAIEYISRMKK